jgi:hypothetical protein
MDDPPFNQFGANRAAVAAGGQVQGGNTSPIVCTSTGRVLSMPDAAL